MNRRDFLIKSSLGGLSAFFLPAFAQAQTSDPHFFIQLHIPKGADFTYLWDARPTSLKEAKIRADYLGETPTPFTPGKGQTLTTSLFEPLKPYADLFTLINGVHMSPDFDGHDQNTNLLLTGNPFGGDFFIPFLNRAGLPLDAISNSAIGANASSTTVGSTLTNDSKIAPLDQSTLKTVSNRVSRTQALIPGNPLFAPLARRYQAIQNLDPAGGLSLGAQLLYSGLTGNEKLRQDFAQLPAPSSDEESLENYLKTVLPLFKMGSTRALFLALPGLSGVDTHDAMSASRTPTLMKQIVAAMATVIRVLKNTPFQNGQSYADVTTFIFTTEMGRSNRQTGQSIDLTGTDHNSFNNSVLIGGKGIVGNQIIGSSDLQIPGEILSGAHLQLDQTQLKIFGRPFDFTSGKPRTDLPAQYSQGDYLTIASVINTVYRSFLVDQSHYRVNGRNTVPAPLIPGLLKS